MIQKIISITILLVIGLLTYNYFFGTAQEREQAQDIFGKGAEVVGASADLLKAEYQKFNDGKYDEALNNINGLLSKLKEKGGEIDDWKKRKEDWDQKKNDLEKLMDSGSGFVDEEVKNPLKI
ncbi:MAG: hypothetical protein IPP22_01755 [Nitrosomonas sp.]|nr:hypothetical protein [Nitrosomonas sp.]